MSRLFALCILIIISCQLFAQKETEGNSLTENCLTPTELELYRQINEYRAQKNLPKVELSASLCYVARTHAIDQSENYKDGKRCNMHSWSAKGNWSSCCYTPDHKKAKCMWDKPRELTSYRGDGYEISFYSTYEYTSPSDYAKDILNGWKKSSGHNDVLINKSIWKNVSWQAIGIGIYGEYANVWFGKEKDSAAEPKPCE
jgi:uncharacterized protein YkwD